MPQRAGGFFHLHLVSDATGETLITVARAAAAQYASVAPIEHIYPLVRTEKQLERVISEIEAAPGIVLYSLADRIYLRLTDRGESATWLSDNRHLLFWDGDIFFLFDTVSRTSRKVRTTFLGSEYNDFSLSPDDRVLYLAHNTEQGDIWLLTLK